MPGNVASPNLIHPRGELVGVLGLREHFTNQRIFGSNEASSLGTAEPRGPRADALFLS
jgi:hypothetical protein